MSFLYCLCLLFHKIGELVLPGSGQGEREEWEGKREEMAQTMYAHMNK
jgi:hypothetical protein